MFAITPKILNTHIEAFFAFVFTVNRPFVSKVPKTNLKTIIFTTLTGVIFFVLSLLGIIKLIDN